MAKTVKCVWMLSAVLCLTMTTLWPQTPPAAPVPAGPVAQGGAPTAQGRPEDAVKARADATSLTIDLGGGVTMEFVLIQPGSFMMGSEKGAPYEKPVHKISITQPFYLGKYEVTQEQWEKVMGSNPASLKARRSRWKQ
jgi:formylglycine-generating enzyme required for sulfatase activity